MVFVKKYILWIFPVWRNVSLEMVKVGLACVYNNSMGVYGGIRQELELEEKRAKAKRRGMWSLKSVVTPMDYKRKLKGL